ncbi:MAG TPA: nucleotide sugar dehydrogenase [candidate division Zixibacteria bacterium]|nr:nucleotide sugar dehydrogenase [candidate division Zixibacteria bacterium]
MSNSTAEALLAKIEDASARICVIGMGYVGLPLAVEACNVGFHVDGYDVSQKKVDILNAGGSDVDDIPAETVARLVGSGLLKNTTDPAIMAEADIILICVPTPLNKTKDPDVSYILDATEKIKTFIKPGTIVVLESTTYPGTTEELILPMIEEAGQKIGEDFFLAFSPERVDPGNPIYQTHNTPKVVGGVTPDCTKIAVAFYEKTIETAVPVSSTKAAEMVKLLENTFRSVNIGLVNELALMCDRLGVDVWEIINAAATKPFGFMPFYPGPGLGGHCIPIDPHYLSWKLKSLNYYARFIELAGEINGNMPAYVVSQVAELLNEFGKPVKGSKILLLGMSYKADISDVRESPSLDLLEILESKGAEVLFNDPLVPSIQWKNGELMSAELTDELLESVDLVLISTNHKTYDWKRIVEKAQLIFDGRNALKGFEEHSNKIYKLGSGRLFTAGGSHLK